MKKSNKCPKCGSAEVISDAKAVDRGHGDIPRELSVATFGRPEALLFKDKKQTTVSAWVCADCGFVEFYADSPDVIRLPGA